MVLRSMAMGFLDRSVGSKRSVKLRKTTGQRIRIWVSADPQEDPVRQCLSLESRGKPTLETRGWNSSAEVSTDYEHRLV